MISKEGLEEQYDEEDSWEEEGFLEGMEEAEDEDLRKKKAILPGELQDEMDEDIESDFEEQFGDDF